VEINGIKDALQKGADLSLKMAGGKNIALKHAFQKGRKRFCWPEDAELYEDEGEVDQSRSEEQM